MDALSNLLINVLIRIEWASIVYFLFRHLILRHSLGNEWAPAAEMAKQVLDIPDQSELAF